MSEAAKAIVPVDVPIVDGRLAPSNLEGQWRIAQMLHKSRLLPAGIETPEAALVVVIAACELRLSYIDTLTGIAAINGRPVLHSRLPMALAIRTGQFKGIDVEYTGTGDSLACKVTVRRKDADGDVMSFVGEFSMADARVAGLLNRPTWKAFPRDMLRARASSRALGIGFADAYGGMGIAAPEDEERLFARKPVVNEAGPAADTESAIDALGDGEAPALPDPASAVPASPPADDKFVEEIIAEMDAPSGLPFAAPRGRKT